MTRRSTLADLFCSLTFLAVTAVSTVAQAAIVPTSGASFVKADWSLASHQDDGGITWTIPGIAYVGSTPAGGASIGLSPRIPGSSTLFGQDALYVDLLTSYHQIAFELFTGNSANRTILTLAGDGAFYIPLDIPSNGSIWVDIYSVNPITRLTLAPLTPLYQGNNFIIGSIFLSNSNTPLYGEQFGNFPTISPVPEPTSTALLVSGLIALVTFRRRKSI